MRAAIKSLVISTVVVVGYMVILGGIACIAVPLLGAYRASGVIEALSTPLSLPMVVLQVFFGGADVLVHGKMQMVKITLLLGWFVTLNSVLYYIPIRMFLNWRESRAKYL